MKKLERIFKSLGDPNRLRIIKMLEVRPLCNCEVQEILELAPSTVSKHLGLLRDAGLVEDERKGKWVIYRLAQSEETPYSFPVLALMKDWLLNETQIKSDLTKVRQMEGKFACDIGT